MEKSSVRSWAKFFLALLFVVDIAVAVRILGAAHQSAGLQIFWWVWICLGIAASWIYSVLVIFKRAEVATTVVEGFLGLAGWLMMTYVVFWAGAITFVILGSAGFFIVTAFLAVVLTVFYASVRMFCYLALEK
ncbi:MAG: hypothetical protein WAV56_00100 [Microgenomates group bacterium]